ncbi:MAG TPA: hypothetical protein VFV10_09595 [Gammaproteobacteria bacterium]|nr:hypothetical protein [Gammaproteobacteria bacterium]
MTLRTVGVNVREHVGSLDQQALVRDLRAEPGIGDVFFNAAEPHRLFIAYDPAMLNDSVLLTRLYRHGVHPEPVAPKPSALAPLAPLVPLVPLAGIARAEPSATPLRGQAALWTAPWTAP